MAPFGVQLLASELSQFVVLRDGKYPAENGDGSDFAGMIGAQIADRLSAERDGAQFVEAPEFTTGCSVHLLSREEFV
jgi:hypothetical protein